MGQPNQNKTNQNHNGIMASIKPLGQRVLVKRLDAEEVSAGGIVLPDTAQEKPQEAEVVALGTGGKDENGNDIQFSVEAGNKVRKKLKSSHSALAEKMKTETISNSRSRRATKSSSRNTGERTSKEMEQISLSSTRETS